MEAYKQEFIKFMVESDVLKFGSFTLKSGRQSPFFMNAGAYVTGYQLKKLGEYYAQAIHDNFGDDFDVLFGPAYKGIPLAVVTAIAYHELYGKEVKYCCDRKEAKDHGADKGNLLGYEPQDGDRVVMVEDVTTSGKSIDETYPKVKAAADVEIKGLIATLNRMEVGRRRSRPSTVSPSRASFPWPRSSRPSTTTRSTAKLSSTTSSRPPSTPTTSSTELGSSYAGLPTRVTARRCKPARAPICLSTSAA